MRITVQVALICWLTVLLAVSVRPQVLTPDQNGEAHLRIERELADHAARVMTTEREIYELKSLKIAERLATIESTQQTNQYILVSILLSVLMLLLKDVRTWFRKGRS